MEETPGPAADCRSVTELRFWSWFWSVLLLFFTPNVLLAGGAAEPEGYLQVAALAQKCLNRKRKNRPAMTEVRTA